LPPWIGCNNSKPEAAARGARADPRCAGCSQLFTCEVRACAARARSLAGRDGPITYAFAETAAQTNCSHHDGVREQYRRSAILPRSGSAVSVLERTH
jgi:hypothetical protein